MKFLALFAINMLMILAMWLVYLLWNPEPLVFNYESVTNTRALLVMLLFAPFAETLMFQFFFIELFSLANKKIFPKINSHYFLIAGAVTSAVLFFYVHWHYNSRFNGLVFGLPGSIIFAITYLSYRGKRIEAVFSTWMMHLLSNAYVLLMTVVFYKFIHG